VIIFGFLPQSSKMKAVAVAFSMARLEAGVEPQPERCRARDRLADFRRELYRCFTARADAVLCADGPVKTLAGLSVVPEHRRGHGALHDAVNAGRVEIGRLRRAVAGLPLPRAAPAGTGHGALGRCTGATCSQPPRHRDGAARVHVTDSIVAAGTPAGAARRGATPRSAAVEAGRGGWSPGHIGTASAAAAMIQAAIASAGRGAVSSRNAAPAPAS
jgi:DDE superfamily endonuclease